MTELKPCPFCGSTSIDEKGWASSNSAGPACDDCGASAGNATGTLEGNIAAWNRRAERAAGGVDVTDADIAEWVERHDLGGVLSGIDARCAFDDARTFVSDAALSPRADSVAPVKPVRVGVIGHVGRDKGALTAALMMLAKRKPDADSAGGA
ncbi:Lar family restriction alleviation protein [Luteimonas sp. RIT-PG2_3]